MYKIRPYVNIGALILLCLMFATPGFASSHREAPLIANDPLADNTDVYAFRSPDAPNTVTLIANYVPLQLPHGGPNYYQFGENIRYELHIDNDVTTPGDDIIYRFTFTQTNEDPTTFFNIRLGAENLKTTYIMERSMDGGATFQTVLSNAFVAPYNIGERSIESAVGYGATSYEDLFNQAIITTADGEKVFCGPTDDPFFVDLGGIFDLGDAPRQSGMPKDGVSCLNVSTIAVQVPISMLQKDNKDVSQAADILDGDFVIGVWASASRQQMRTLSSNGAPSYSGNWVQVSRLGMPLTNEAVIPIGDKDEWNARTPYNENPAHFEYFYNPELGLYMDDALFGGAVPAFSALRIQRNSLGGFDFGNGNDGLFGLKGSAAVAGTALDDAIFGTLLLPGPGKPRSVDLWPAFHTGVPNFPPYQLATGKGGNPLAAGKPFVNNFLPNGGDMLRLNMATPATDRTDPGFSSLGLIQAAVLGLTDPTYASDASVQAIPNMDGFPNGRRLEDDVTRIELQAVSGVVLAAIGLWYDDFDPNDPNASPVTQDLIDVLTFTTGVEANDLPFRPTFPYVAMPWSGTGKCGGDSIDYTQPAILAPTQSVASFMLADGDKDQVVGPITSGDTIYLDEVGTDHLNFKAVTNPEVVGSVGIVLSGPVSRNQTENNAPYYLAGDQGSNIHFVTLTQGNYSLVATPYTESKLNGTAGNALTLNFVVMNTRPQAVTSFTLINADTDQTIGPLQDGDVIDLANIGTNRLNAQAFTNPSTVGSVEFEVNGFTVTENKAPYAAGGNSGNDFHPISVAPGTYTLTATPYAKRNLKGDKGQALSVTFTVINSGPPFRLENDVMSLYFNVYPNPVSDFLIVEMDEAVTGPVQLALYNLQGQLLVSKTMEAEAGTNVTKINLSDYPQGQYYLHVRGDSWTGIKQLVKE